MALFAPEPLLTACAVCRLSTSGQHPKASELREAHYPATEPIAVGYTFAELKEGGYPAAELLRAAGYSAAELLALRYTLAEVREGGFTFDDIRHLGFPAAELVAAGFRLSAAELALLDVGSKGSELPKTIRIPKVHAALDCIPVVESTGWFGSKKTTSISVRVRLERKDKPEPRVVDSPRGGNLVPEIQVQ